MILGGEAHRDLMHRRQPGRCELNPEFCNTNSTTCGVEGFAT